MSDVEFNVESHREIGMLLPDGTEIWPGDTWHGRGIETTQDRQVILGALQESARNLNIAASGLLDNYHWLVRISHRYTTTVPGTVEGFPLDSPDFVEENVTEPVNGEHVPPPVYDAEVIDGDNGS